MNMVQHKLLQLATGALLHDVGMLRVPAEVRNKTGQLTAEEVKEVSKWPSREEQLSLLMGQILGPGATLSAQLLGPGKLVASQVKQKGEGEE